MQFTTITTYTKQPPTNPTESVTYTIQSPSNSAESASHAIQQPLNRSESDNNQNSEIFSSLGVGIVGAIGVIGTLATGGSAIPAVAAMGAIAAMTVNVIEDAIKNSPEAAENKRDQNQSIEKGSLLLSSEKLTNKLNIPAEKIG